MFPLPSAAELIHLRHEDLLREAERERLSAGLPTRTARWRSHAGNGLIRLGTLVAGGTAHHARPA